VARAELATVQELEALSDAGVALLRAWHRGSAAEVSRRAGLPLAEIVAGELLVFYLQALKASFLLARLRAGGPAGETVVAPVGWAAVEAGLAAFDEPPAIRFAADPSWPVVLRAGPAFWSRLRSWRRQARYAASDAGDPSGAPTPGVFVGLPNYRNRVLLEWLDAEGLPVCQVAARGENTYLPVANGADRRDAEVDRIWNEASSREPSGEVLSFPEAPGWDPWRLLRALLKAPGADLARKAVREVDTWRGWLREHRPRAVIGGIPWSGDLRALVFAGAAEGVPFLAVQDGALSTVAIGGLVPPVSVLAWGPEGRRWFVDRGCEPDRVAMIGDPYLEHWLARTDRVMPLEARRRLGLPREGRVVLGVLQNSAPHALVEDPGAPLEEMLGVARGVAEARGWTLCVKPHPRLPRVDGWACLAEAWHRSRCTGAVLLSPFTDVAVAMAGADVYVSHGDTLTLEALAARRPAVLWNRGEAPSYYPDFLESDVPRARSADELRRVLDAGPEVAGRELLRRHLSVEEEPAAAVVRLTETG
jgi:hypothetical protein